MATVLDLLKKVVLVLAHHCLPILFPLLQLVFERLGIDAHAAFCHDLLPSVAGNANTDAELE